MPLSTPETSFSLKTSEKFHLFPYRFYLCFDFLKTSFSIIGHWPLSQSLRPSTFHIVIFIKNVGSVSFFFLQCVFIFELGRNNFPDFFGHLFQNRRNSFIHPSTFPVYFWDFEKHTSWFLCTASRACDKSYSENLPRTRLPKTKSL